MSARILLAEDDNSLRLVLSQALGKETIDTRTHGVTRGRSGSSNTNYQNAGRELLMPDEVRMLSPVPETARLRSLPTESFMTPRWARTVELFNHNIRVLNDLLFGDQDFAIVARVRPQGRI